MLEASGQVGGLARTEMRDGYRFDLGGHRFFTKSPEVESLWLELLGPELLLRRRLSRIYWRGRLIDYPLRAGDVVRKVGAAEVVRSAASYAAARMRPRRRAETFEQWVSQRFGRRLFELFFRSYTEKVWGVPTTEIRAEWAAQRIRGLSLWRAARSALGAGDGDVRSLIEEFHYPRLGPGQMWERMAAETVTAGGEVALDSPVSSIRIGDGEVEVEVDGESLTAANVISSLPLRTLAGIVEPAPPPAVLEAAAGLRYRDFICVALVLDGADPFPDNWIYVHDPEVQVGRIQNFRAWSPDLVPDPERTCLGMEYFCFEGDELWEAADEALVARAAAELESLGLARARSGRRRARRPGAEGLPDLRLRLRTAPRDAASLARRPRRAGPDRPQRAAPLQQLRPLDADRDARGREHCDGRAHDIWAVNADSAYLEEGEVEEPPYRDAPATPAMARPLAAETAGPQEIS